MSIDGRISPRQVAWLIVTVRTAVVMVSVASLQAGVGRNAWLAEMAASGLMIIMAWVVVTLSLRFPRKTLIEIGEIILGKYLGKLLGIVILWFFLFVAATLTREAGEFLKTVFYENTPIIVLIILLTLVNAYGVWMGLEAIAKVNDIFFFLVLSMFISIWLLLVRNVELEQLLPVFQETGLLPIIKGGAVVAPEFMFLLAIAMIFPYITQQKRVFKLTVLGVLLQGFIIVNMIILAIGILGPGFLEVLNFPGLFLSDTIEVAKFIENIDAFFMAVWVAATFIKVAMFYFCLVLGTGQIFQLENVKLLVIPTGALIVALAMAAYESFLELLNFYTSGWVIHNWFFLFFIPAGLLMLAVILQKKES